MKTQQYFKEFVNKESFEKMVKTWEFHHNSKDLTEQGERKYNLMKSLMDWKESEYNPYFFEKVAYNYECCIECGDYLGNFFDIE